MAGAESQHKNPAGPPSRLRVDDLLVDLERCTVHRGSELLDITDRSFRLLASLIRHAPEQVSKDQLIAEVWDDAVVSDETLAQRVRLLRQSLGDNSQQPRYIASVRGRGYRLVAQLAGAGVPATKRRAAVAVLIAAVVLLIGLAVAWQTLHRFEDQTSGPAGAIAVLPFKDMSASKERQFFADGMHEELLTQLAMIDGLAVVSRTSVERYRDSDASLPEIASQLGADAVIEGSVRVDDNRLRVTVQLIEASTDEHIWAANFDRELAIQDIFDLQTDVAEQIAQALQLNYVREAGDGRQLPTDSIDAYNFYLLGRYHTFKQTRRDLETAVTNLQQAIDIDPEFAEAYAALGWAYSFLGAEYSSRLPAEMYPKAREAALRAIALDASLADARSLYADILTWYDWDFAAAEREFLKVIELDPLNVLGYALFLSAQERHDEAITLIERRLESDPNDVFIQINAAWRYLAAGQLDRAIESAAAASEHTDSKSILGWSRIVMGDVAAAIDIFESAIESDGRTARNVANLAVAYFRGDRPDDGELLLSEMEEFAESNYLSPVLLAAVYFAADDPDRGFALLEQGFEERSREMIFLRVNYMLDGYRDDPRYPALIEKVGPRR